MDLKRLLESNLDKAFTIIASLAKDATLSMKTSKEFNFGSSTQQATAQSLVTKAILLESSKTSSSESGHNSKKARLLLKTKAAGSLELYDQVTINKETWSIGPVISDSGYTVLIEVFKE